MTADDLSAPLGRGPKKRRSIKIPIPQIAAGALGLFLAVFVLWAVVADDPLGGEPMAVVPTSLHVAAQTINVPAAPDATAQQHDAAAATAAPPAKEASANTTTVTIIDGKTGARQEVVIPAPPASGEALGGAASPDAAPVDQKFVDQKLVDQKFMETTPHGAIPKIAADGTRPADAFARPVRALAGKPGAPRIALIIGGLGVSVSTTADAIAKLPGPVTLGFVPYGTQEAVLVARARSEGHEILLQVPMEPFDYPNNDPGPQTLLTTLTPQQNIDRLYWLMSQFQGYVGLSNMMGARFTASEDSLGPILRETAKRGLIFIDDGSNPRSVAGRIATASNLPYAQADVVVDAVPTPAEIDRALGRLEMAAREHGGAIGIASALPVSIDHIAKWAKAAEGRGLLLVPITAMATKAKQS